MVLGCGFSRCFFFSRYFFKDPKITRDSQTFLAAVNRGTDKKNKSIFQQHNCAFIKLLRYSYYVCRPRATQVCKTSCLIRREEDKPIRHEIFHQDNLIEQWWVQEEDNNISQQTNRACNQLLAHTIRTKKREPMWCLNRCGVWSLHKVVPGCWRSLARRRCTIAYEALTIPPLRFDQNNYCI